MSADSSAWNRVTLLWPIACMLVAFSYAEWRVSNVETELVARPPIAVLPVDASVIRIIDENPGIKAEEAIKRVRAAAERLADSGYVVLNVDQVYGYPIDVEARP